MSAAANRSTKTARSRLRAIGEIINELKKVVWLSRREVIYLSTLVLVISVAAGLLLGAIDYGFTALVENIFLGH
jgi:preprotein translocase subunit SecE